MRLLRESTREAFVQHKYIGYDNEKMGYTKGNEYSRILVGTYFFDNTLGVYVTNDEYDGDDIDFCCFFGVKDFNKLFTPGIPLLVSPPRGERMHQEFLKKKKKIKIAKHNFGNSYVDKTLKEGEAGKLYSISYKCTCSTCERVNPIRERRRLVGINDKMREFMAGEVL